MADIRIKYKVDKGELVLAKKELERINKELGIGKDKANQSTSALKGVGTAIVAAFTVDKIIDFGRQVVAVTAEFQKLQAVLTNTLGSKSAADAAFTRIQDFASKTPFAVSQLTASFVKLANQGFVPTNEELRKLGDLAASTGKDFDQLTEAIIDAQVGEFERLKEFGIRASKQGDQVTFAFKGVETQTEFTQEAIRDYLLTLGDLEGVSGSMAAISKTLGGQISNLGDSFDSLFFAVGNATGGIISDAISALNIAVQSATELINLANGVSTKAADIFNELNKEFSNVEKPEDYANAIEEIEKRIESLQTKATGEGADLINATKEAKNLKELEDQLESIGDSANVTVSEFEQITESIIDNGIQINVLNDFLAKLRKEKELLTGTNVSENESLTNLSETYKVKLIDVIRQAQQEIHKLGDNDATLEQIEEFLSDMDESFVDADDKIAEREQLALERFNAIEIAKRAMALETSNARLDLESETVNGLIGITRELGKSTKEAQLGFFLFEKALSIVDVVLNLQRELSNIAAYSAANPLNAITAGAAGAATFAGNAAIAKTRAGFRIATIGAQTIGAIAGFKDGVIDLKGPGTTTSDDIPAMLSRGESVLTARETSDFMPTLKAIRENRIDPELLNSIARGGSGGHSVINQVIEVPRDELRLDLDGFSLYQKRKNQRVIKKESRYRW